MNIYFILSLASDINIYHIWHTDRNTYIHISVCICIYVCVCIYMCVCRCVCVYWYIRIYGCIYGQHGNWPSVKTSLFYWYATRLVGRCPSSEPEELDNPHIRKLFTNHKPGSSWNTSQNYRAKQDKLRNHWIQISHLTLNSVQHTFIEHLLCNRIYTTNCCSY